MRAGLWALLGTAFTVSCSSGSSSAQGGPSDAGVVSGVDGATGENHDGATEAIDGAPGGTPDGASHGMDASTPRFEAGPMPPDPCVEAGTCPPGTWTNVTPPGVDFVNGACGNYGADSVVVDPARPAELYMEVNCQGIWKSTDYGLTWNGPVNTGSNGAAAGNCAGGITIGRGAAGGPPVLYEACIRGSIGFWASTNGGVDWMTYPIAPLPSNRQDVYPPAVDPYDSQHLIMTGHEQDYIVETQDGGKMWTNVALAAGMDENGGTGIAFFLDTGAPATTASTWLWLAQQSGGTYGTWRTSSGGATWTQVNKNEHPHGSSQIYQPDGNGTVYMGGAYASEGWGVLRSGDYGQTWTHVGGTGNESAVFGTPKSVYAMYGWAVGASGTSDPSFEGAPQPGTGTWTHVATPAAMTQGPGQVAVTSDGVHGVFVAACWNDGVWRYVEP